MQDNIALTLFRGRGSSGGGHLLISERHDRMAVAGSNYLLPSRVRHRWNTSLEKFFPHVKRKAA
jgi:hypothetical protein